MISSFISTALATFAASLIPLLVFYLIKKPDKRTLLVIGGIAVIVSFIFAAANLLFEEFFAEFGIENKRIFCSVLVTVFAFSLGVTWKLLCPRKAA